MKAIGFGELVGLTLRSVEVAEPDKDEIILKTQCGRDFRMWHEQDCCESVYVEDIIGDLDDLIGSPITMAEKSSNSGDGGWGTQTWTFYKLATIKGYVTLRWLGESNGYYSEAVDFQEITA